MTYQWDVAKLLCHTRCLQIIWLKFGNIWVGMTAYCAVIMFYVCAILWSHFPCTFLLLGIIVHSDKCYWWKVLQYKVSIPPSSSSLNKQKHLRMETALVHYVGCGPVWTLALPSVCGLVGHVLVLILKRGLEICDSQNSVFIWCLFRGLQTSSECESLN